MSIRFKCPKCNKQLEAEHNHITYKKKIFVFLSACFLFTTSNLYAGWLNNVSKITKLSTSSLTKKNNSKKTTTNDEQNKKKIVSSSSNNGKAKLTRQQKLAALAERERLACLAKRKKYEEKRQRWLAEQKKRELEREKYRSKYREALLADNKQKAEEYKKHLSYNDWTEIANNVFLKKMELERKRKQQRREQILIPIHNKIKERAKKLGYKRFKRGNVGDLLHRAKIAPRWGGKGLTEIINPKGIVYLSDNIDSIIKQNSRLEGYTQYIRSDMNLVFLLKTKEPLVRGKGLDVTKGHVFTGFLDVKTIYGEKQKLPVFEEI